MGANRKPLVSNSVGETLAEKHGISPQVMSYVLPLLVEEGFCTVSDRKPFVIHRRPRREYAADESALTRVWTSSLFASNQDCANCRVVFFHRRNRPRGA